MEALYRIIRKKIPAEGQSVAFGVILFTDRHANLRKVIDDDDYCKALNEISGSKWTVFASRVKQGKTEMPRIPRGYFGMMYMRWVEPKENLELIEALGLDSSRNLPCLVVLFPDDEGNAFTHTIKLDDETPGSAYDSLKDAIAAVTDAIEDVLPENLKNSEGLHAAVALKLETVQQWKFIKKALPFLGWVKKLAF